MAITRSGLITVPTYGMSKTAWRAMRMRYPLAYRTGRFMYNNRENFMRARATMIRARRSRTARVIGRAGRNFIEKRRVRRQLGERIGTSTAKVHDALNETGFYSTRTLYDHDLLDIPHTTGDGDLRSERQRQVANIRGYKICAAIQNDRTAPLFVNVAILATKTGTFGTNDFFRGDGNERSVTFGTALSSIQFRCCPINTDKYHVLMHRRMLFNGTSEITGQDKQRTTYQLLEKYVPLKRQIRWENENGGTTSNEDIRLVWWADILMQPSAALAQSDAYTIQWKVVTYFRDPKS